MDPEPGRRGDVGDVAQEIGADDGVVAAARRAEHGRPRGIDDGLPVIRQMRLAVGEQPVGNGPYKFESWTHNSSIV